MIFAFLLLEISENNIPMSIWVYMLLWLVFVERKPTKRRLKLI